MRRFILLIIPLLGLFTACDDSDITPEQSITLKVSVKHHSLLVPGAEIYLEKSDEFPGTEPAFYSSSTLADEWAVGVFTELSEGTYWMYSEGFDGSDSVRGYNSIFLTDTLLLDIVETELQVSE